MNVEAVLRHSRVVAKPHVGIRLDDKIQFFIQFATVLRAGMPLMEALSLCAGQSLSLRMAELIRDVTRRCSAGSSLHAALAQYPRIFDFQWVQVVRTGEVTGQLAEVMTQLADYIVEAREVRGKVVSALIYPVILSAVSFGALIVMLTVVVPTFADLFASMGGKLPAITQAVIDASHFVTTRWPTLLAGAIVVIVAFRAFVRSAAGRTVCDLVLMCLPVIGDLVCQATMQKFSMNLGLLLRSGSSLLEALTIVRGIFGGSAIYAAGLGQVEHRVRDGAALAASLAKSGLFAPLLVNMVKVGEESGKLADVLGQVSVYYKRKVAALVTRVTSLMEPLIVVGMGGMVAVLLLAIYLPMFSMAGGVR
ncbi:MAG: type II secretion system F family protein [Planctomycetes bacterium]|nr:type II secretion system F family protein [Planctomycetota bacterium]